MFFTRVILVATVLTHVQNWMSTWGYLALFGLLFSCGLGVPLPEDIPLLLGGYFIAIGKMHLFWAAIAAWTGIVGGDCILYYFGHHFGHKITRVPFIGKHINESRLEFVEHLFKKYGFWVVAIGRLFAGVRGVMVVAAGTIRYSFPLFIIADGLAAIVSGGLFLALGHWAGKKFGDLETLRHKVQHYEHYVLGAVVLLIALAIAWHFFKKRWHGPSLTDLAMAKVAEKAGVPTPTPDPVSKPGDVDLTTSKAS